MAIDRFARGTSATLSAEVRDGVGNLADASALTLDILNPTNVVLVAAAPVHDSLGRYHYTYAVSGSADLGVYSSQWEGTLNGSPISATDYFEVVESGEIIFPSDSDHPPCTVFATTDDLCTPCDSYSFPTGLLDEMLETASQLVYRLTGEQWTGMCSEVVHPRCQARHATVAPSRSWSGGCCGSERISLGGYPLREILEVIIDGETLDASEYRIEDDRWLVRADCTAWPCSCSCDQDFSVEYLFGADPPPAVVKATADLACQLALACSPETLGDCVLPGNVSSITRQGVSAELIPLDAFQDGKSGLASLDRVIWAFNPDGARGRAVVARADIGRAVTRRT